MRQDGYSIIELLIILAFLGVILVIATPLTLENVRRAKVENEAQTLYSNIAEARQRAVQRSINYILQIEQDKMEIFEDRNNDNVADATEKIDALCSPSGLPYKLQGTVGTTAISTTVLTATSNKKGFIQPSMLIFLDQSAPGASAVKGVAQEGRHNCLTVDFTRVSLGKYNGSTCQVQ